MAVLEAVPQHPAPANEANRAPVIARLREAAAPVVHALKSAAHAFTFESLKAAPRLAHVSASADASLESRLSELRDAFAAHAGTKIVFDRSELSPGRYYDRLPPLPLERRVRAAEIALEEVKKYPAGFHAKLGLETIGIFDSCVSLTNDGFHQYDAHRGGYLYYGLYNFEHGAVGAYYTDQQLRLTFHHESFHGVDANLRGSKSLENYESDNDAFAKAVEGSARYKALAISPQDLAELKRVARGVVLEGAVSAYTTKSPDEDQAETARHFMTNIADSLIQACERPELPGSQRILHVLEQYQTCIKDGPGVSWFIDCALGRAPQKAPGAAPARPARAPVRPAPFPAPADTPDEHIAVELPDPNLRIPQQHSAVTELFKTITDQNRQFVVRGSSPDDSTPNPTLQADVRSFVPAAQELLRAQRSSMGNYGAADDIAELVGILDAYQSFVDFNLTLTDETRKVFGETREKLLSFLPERPRREIFPRLFNRHYLSKVDRAIESAHKHHPFRVTVRNEIRKVQPAVVWLDRASGVNIHADGTILTNAHVARELHREIPVWFPNGEKFKGVCTAIDFDADLAIVKLEGVNGKLPFARFEDEKPKAGTDIVMIGQPHTYDHWHVSTGKIAEYKETHPWKSSVEEDLGGLVHTAWTYFGNSGSPIFDLDGDIVALHNSWDRTNANRHGVPYDTVMSFLRRNGVRFEFDRD